MGIGEKVERDVRSVAEYWGRRKREFIEEPALAFEQIVRPAIHFESEPDPLVETQVNATFTEWMLFDCMLDERGTLLERYVRKPPAGVADSRRDPRVLGVRHHAQGPGRGDARVARHI